MLQLVVTDKRERYGREEKKKMMKKKNKNKKCGSLRKFAVVEFLQLFPHPCGVVFWLPATLPM